MATKKLQLPGFRIVDEEDYGKSAFELAQDHGFKGTEEEWIDSLKGASGVYVGSGEMPEGCNVQIDPEGEAVTLESLVNEVGRLIGQEFGMVNTESGNPLVLRDSVDAPLKGLTLKSRNLFNKEAGRFEFTENGATYGAYIDVRLSVWKYVEDTSYSFVVPCMPNTGYTLSGISNASIVRIATIAEYDEPTVSHDVPVTLLCSDSGVSSVTVTTNQEATYMVVQVSSAVVDTAQLEIGSVATPYVPYFSGGDVTVKVMGRNIADIYGFSADGIISPTSSRAISNNYGTTLSTTDPADVLVVTQSSNRDDNPSNYGNGYFCIGFHNDLKQGDCVTVSFDVEITGNLSNHDSITFMVNGDAAYTTTIANGRFKYTFSNWKYSGTKRYIEIRNGGKSMKISNFQVEYGTTATDYEPYKEQTLVVSVPDGLAAGEQFEVNDFAKLHIYKPATTIINDVGAVMSVEYVINTKAYIDEQLGVIENGSY